MPQTVLPGQFCTKTRRPFQLLCALFQCGLLLPQDTPQRCIACKHGSDDRKRHIQHAQHSDELEGVDIPGGVIAVVIALSACRCKKPFFFVKADVRGGHAALL